ncbi:hypothetical protein GCM10009096_33930 [Parasphingorhabdus litoris]|uniref:Tetratricopeptide repeat protein n=1 Tax=Parasphingorhabdus litoris TaxID=394733 RepID=A0ABP3KVY0_9SPHN|nr:hypothetical protein [Parasphingorhabdus litoris]
MSNKKTHNIIARLKKGYYWSQALFYFQEKNYKKSISYFNKYALYKEVLPVAEKAFEATILIGNNESEQAQKKFESLLNGLTVDSDQEMYVKNYSELYLSLITKDDCHMIYFRKLQEIPVSKDISQILPLPKEEALIF